MSVLASFLARPGAAGWIACAPTAGRARFALVERRADAVAAVRWPMTNPGTMRRAPCEPRGAHDEFD
jgi:hypothetical protein